MRLFVIFLRDIGEGQLCVKAIVSYEHCIVNATCIIKDDGRI